MTLVNKTLSEMLDEIEYRGLMRYDILIPEENPELFQEVSLVKGAHLQSVQIPNEEYLDTLCSLMCPDKAIIDDFRLALRETFYNSFEYGNRLDGSLPISVKIFDGVNGAVLRIRDSGDGFDFRERVENTGEKPKYFGNKGFWNFAKESYSVSFEGDGSILNLEVLNN